MEQDHENPSSAHRRKHPGTPAASFPAGYRPRRMTDYLFLHGLALRAARRTLREDRAKLYPPAEWFTGDG